MGRVPKVPRPADAAYDIALQKQQIRSLEAKKALAGGGGETPAVPEYSFRRYTRHIRTGDPEWDAPAWAPGFSLIYVDAITRSREVGREAVGPADVFLTYIGSVPASEITAPGFREYELGAIQIPGATSKPPPLKPVGEATGAIFPHTTYTAAVGAFRVAPDASSDGAVSLYVGFARGADDPGGAVYFRASVAYRTVEATALA